MTTIMKALNTTPVSGAPTPRLAGPTSPMTRRRRSSLGSATPSSLSLVSPLDSSVQQALTSDEFIQRRKKRGGNRSLVAVPPALIDHDNEGVSINTVSIPPARRPNSVSRSISSSSPHAKSSSSTSLSTLASSPSSIVTLKPLLSTGETDPRKSPTKRLSVAKTFASNQRSRSRPRSPKTSKSLASPSLSSPPSPPSPSLFGVDAPSLSPARSVPASATFSARHATQRSTSASSCPEPRGATLSLAPSTSIPRTSSILAEGHLGKHTSLAAVEVLADLRNSARSSESGDDEYELVDDVEEGALLVYDCTAPHPIPDLPPTDCTKLSESSRSPRSPRSPYGLVQLHHRTRPAFIRSQSSPTINALSGMKNLDGLRRLGPAAPLSTSPPSQEFFMPRSPVSPGRATPCSVGLSLALTPDSSESLRPSTHRRSSASSSHSNQGLDTRASSSLGIRSRRSSDASQKIRIDPQRPPLHTYTSFESAFDVAPPPSPPPSPKPSKGWPWIRN